MKALRIGLVLSALVFPTAALSVNHAADAKSTQASQSMTDGEIRKVDKDAKKLTIKHGPIQNLDMPAMTMVFRVKEAGMLDQVKSGDKIKFVAEKVGGQYTVTHVEAVK